MRPVLTEALQYGATAGGLASICGVTGRIICLHMRLRFAKDIADLAVKQEQKLDPAEIIRAATTKQQDHRLAN